MKGDPFANKDAWDQLHAKSRVHREPGGKNLLMFFRNSRHMTVGELTKIAPAFQNGAWKESPGNFEMMYGDFIKILIKVDNRRKQS